MALLQYFKPRGNSKVPTPDSLPYQILPATCTCSSLGKMYAHGTVPVTRPVKNYMYINVSMHVHAHVHAVKLQIIREYTDASHSQKYSSAKNAVHAPTRVVEMTTNTVQNIV